MDNINEWLYHQDSLIKSNDHDDTRRRRRTTMILVDSSSDDSFAGRRRPSGRYDSSIEREEERTMTDPNITGLQQMNALSLFPSLSLPEQQSEAPAAMTGKTIRFADIIATDMEALHSSSLKQDEASPMRDESEDEDATIREDLFHSVTRWAGRKVLDFIRKRVDEEDEDRIAGGDVWGNNPIADHLQIKDSVKALVANYGNRNSTGTAATAAVSPEVLTT